MAQGDHAALERLQLALGYRFRDSALLELALTHSSASGANHQRLEFLGDAVLGAAVGARLFGLQPERSEGAMSVARTRLVCQESLAACARRLGLPALLRVSPAVARSGAVHERESVLADTLEALAGAVFVDGGYAATEALMLRLFGDALAADPASAGKDAKTRLQEWLQARGLPLPVYRLQAAEGPDNAPLFRVECGAGRPGKTASGEGRSRKSAEQAAAERLLAELEPAP